MIVEFRYDITREKGWRWIPLRVRYDKTADFRSGGKNFGNAYHVANSNWHTIHNPISFDMLTSGNDIPDISEDDVLTALVESISDILGVHSRNVVVTIDEDDTVTYSITGETFTDAQEMQNVISNEDFVSNVTADLNEGNTGAVVELIAPNDSIEMILSATIDTSDATGTLDTVEEIRDLTQKLGLTDSVVEGMYISNY